VVKHGDLIYTTVDYDKPDGNYLILESLEQEKNDSRIIHVIKPSDIKETFKLGRGHEADLRINDISVSRCHAFIKFKKDKFLLEDNMSKFGTLVLVREKTPILPNFNKAMQIGRTVVNFSIKSTSSQAQERDLTSQIQSEDLQEKLDDLKITAAKGGIGPSMVLGNTAVNLPNDLVAPPEIMNEDGEDQIPEEH
jgi:hypothetical protein